MTYTLTVSEEWNNIHPEDLWVYNKLYLSRVLGYNCGPAGLPVPKPDFYIVRPCMNFMGMGRNARIEHILDDTEHLHPGEFWCEIFKGEHLSVDYYKKQSQLVVVGEIENHHELYRWKKWTKVDRDDIPCPSILKNLKGEYDWLNVEFIDNKIIEIHFRRNPDFRYNNNIAIPHWERGSDQIPEGYRYIEDKDYKRKGFWVDV